MPSTRRSTDVLLFPPDRKMCVCRSLNNLLKRSTRPLTAAVLFDPAVISGDTLVLRSRASAPGQPPPKERHVYATIGRGPSGVGLWLT